MSKKREKVRLAIEVRGNRFYLSSTDVPGLWLWGNDPEVVFKDVGPTIEALYKHTQGMEVKVRETFSSRFKCWLLVKLFKATQASKQPKVYLVSHRHLNQAHG